MNFIFKENIIPPLDQLLQLYKQCSWINYTTNPHLLHKAYLNSLKTISVWDNETLIGIIRAVGDGCTILYIQDIIVLPDYHRQGIGTKLMHYIIASYPTVRQKILMTDNQPHTIAFYTKLGFVPTEKHNEIAFVNYTL